MDFVPPSLLCAAVNALFQDRFCGGGAKLSKRQRKSLLEKKFPEKYSRKRGFLNGWHNRKKISEKERTSRKKDGVR